MEPFYCWINARCPAYFSIKNVILSFMTKTVILIEPSYGQKNSLLFIYKRQHQWFDDFSHSISRRIRKSIWDLRVLDKIDADQLVSTFKLIRDMQNPHFHSHSQMAPKLLPGPHHQKTIYLFYQWLVALSIIRFLFSFHIFKKFLIFVFLNFLIIFY